MPVSAQELLNRAFDDLGVKAENQVMSPTMAMDGLRRLNSMVSAWANQPLTIPFINRQVFPVTSGQNTYTMGPGGAWDTLRPLYLTGAGLLLNASQQDFTITDADVALNTLTVAGDQTGVFQPGLTFLLTGSTGNNGTYTIVSSVYGTQTTIAPLETVRDDTTNGTISMATASNPVEIPRPILTDEQYQSIQLKQQTSNQFTGVYFNQTYPLATVSLWPTPTTADNSLVIYSVSQLAAFADLTTLYSFPPGYEEALEYNVAVRLIAPYAVSNQTVVADVRGMATLALANIKRVNTKMSDLSTDASVLTHDRHFQYNIQTGTFGY